ncbi:MAG: hypothetical protein DRP66_05635 [Planctomycetota bacterium]|nr:MAG: hypothetical protein DRP66_05635 [Planctomycetota bacterium]
MLQLVSCLFKHKSSKFSDVIEIKRGVLFAKDMLTPDKTSDISHPYFQGDIYRYQTNFIAPSWVEYGPKMREYPKEFKWFEGPRLLLRRLVNRRQRLMASFTPETVITNKNLYTVLSIPPIRHECVLGILNSKLISRLYLAMVSQSTKDDFPQVTIRDIRNLPFPTFNLSNPTDKSRHDKMVSLVQTMLDLNKVLQTAKTPDEKTALQRQITATDNQIDQLVYELYDLTEEEIKIVEAATR